MKLMEIAPKSAPPGTAEYLERNLVDYTMNDDGTIDINQDFMVVGAVPLNFPKINRVKGNFKMNLGSGRVWHEIMPSYVDQECIITIGDGHAIKSSQIPRSTYGRFPLTLTGKGTVELDDETISSYSNQLIDARITGGLQFAPREWNIRALSLLDTVDGIPPVMENLGVLIMTLHDPNALKGFNNRIKSVNAESLIVYCTEDTPLLGLLKIQIKTMCLIHYNGLQSASPQPLNQIMAQGFNGNLSLFEVQEQLIDAGYTKHARR